MNIKYLCGLFAERYEYSLRLNEMCLVCPNGTSLCCAPAEPC